MVEGEEGNTSPSSFCISGINGGARNTTFLTDVHVKYRPGSDVGE